MRRFAPASVLLLATFAACVPPRESVDGQSVDGRTQVALDIRPASGDSVSGTGTLRVAGRPVPVRLRGRWNEKGDGIRNLVGTLRADTATGESWSIAWSPSELNGSLRDEDGAEVRINMPEGR
jgi:hypothetical protein